MLKAITFDFWGTLYRDTPEGVAAREALRQKLLGEFFSGVGAQKSESEIRAAWRKASQAFVQAWQQQARSINTRERIEIFLQALGLSVEEAATNALVRHYEEITLAVRPRLLPDVATTIPKLARQYRLGVICDTGVTPGRVLREVLRQDELLSCFRALIFSDEVGRTKPSTDVFRAALQTLKVTPRQAVHVGDLVRTDLRGARKMSMRALLITHANPHGRHHMPKVPVADRFRDLPRLIARLT